MSENLRTLADRIERQLLPVLNIAVLLIPVIALAMELGSGAAGLAASRRPAADLASRRPAADGSTPAQTRTRVEQPLPAMQPIADRSLADPLLGYGI